MLSPVGSLSSDIVLLGMQISRACSEKDSTQHTTFLKILEVLVVN